jgi:hypothetical protein
MGRRRIYAASPPGSSSVGPEVNLGSVAVELSQANFQAIEERATEAALRPIDRGCRRQLKLG